MSNRIPLPPPALTRHPSGKVYFSPQQMQAYAAESVAAALLAAYDAGFAASGEGWNGEYPGNAAESGGYLGERAEFIESYAKVTA